MNTNTIQTGPAIIVAGVIIAIAIFITNSPRDGSTVKVENAPDTKSTISFNLKDPNEHVLGSADAKVVMIEYSDIDCPFCRKFHPVMEQIVAEYDGDVAWIYRHFPLEGLHPDAFTKAKATECVAQALGNDAFWKYMNVLITNEVAVSMLDDEAVKIGMTAGAFNTCMDGTASDEAIQADIQSGISIGTTGTPNTILINSKGEQEIIKGAADYASVKAKIDKLLAE
jgi:protein-disulfide isomerase